MTNLISIKDYKESQGHLERPYGQCGCECDSFHLVLSDWGDDPYVWALECRGCREIVELEPPMVITCELE
jgi:hypothetical protein